MKLKFLAIAIAATAMAACSGNRNAENSTENNEQDDELTVAVDLNGQWYLDNIVVGDSVNIRPAEEVSDVRQYITFDGESYFIQTNCNTFSGSYTLAGDSIVLGDGPATLMACENMVTEDALRQVLPGISTVTVENDSTVRLNSNDPSGYIILRKATEKK